MIKASIKKDEQAQKINIRVTVKGSTEDIGLEFAHFIIDFADDLNKRVPDFGLGCVRAALSELEKKGAEA